MSTALRDWDDLDKGSAGSHGGNGMDQGSERVCWELMAQSRGLGRKGGRKACTGQCQSLVWGAGRWGLAVW